MSKPMVISIGPALCGKTTYLNSLSRELRVEVKVVAIDDMEGVYIPIPLAHARRIITGSTTIVCRERFADKRSHGLLHSERLLEVSGEEGRIMLQLLCGDLSFDEAITMLESVWTKCASLEKKDRDSRDKGKGKGKEKDGDTLDREASLIERHRALIEVVNEEIKGEELKMKSRHFQMFCGPAIPFAASECKKTLERHAKSEPYSMICFGNTNTVIGHFEVALDIAYRTKRPVQFARFKSELADIPLKELFRRNMRRFAETGKYIPLHAIIRQIEQSEDILFTNGRPRGPKEISALAGFVMNDSALVEPKKRAGARAPKVNQGVAAPPKRAWKKIEDNAASVAGSLAHQEDFPDTVLGFGDPYGDDFADPYMSGYAVGPPDSLGFSYSDASSGVTLAAKEIAYREAMAASDVTAVEIPPSDENIAALMEMGFDLMASFEALKAYGDNLDAAMNALLGG